MARQYPFRLILASGSPARRELLRRAGYDFEVRPANIDEPTGAGFDNPAALVQHIAWLKAAAVAPLVEEGVVLTADTLGWIHGQPVGKPADEADARRILSTLAGTEHGLWTGVCLWRRPDDMQVAWQEESRVAMRTLSAEEMDAYLASRQWVGCSGAYAIQEEGDPLIQVVRGSVTNVIGLPMETTRMMLDWFASIPLPE